MHKTPHCNATYVGVRYCYSHFEQSSIFSPYTVTVPGGIPSKELRKLVENRGCAGGQKLGQWGDYLCTRGIAVDGPPEPHLQTATVRMVTC